MLGRELTLSKAVVGLDVLNIRVRDLAPEEVKVLHVGLLLDDSGGRHGRLVFCLEDGLLTVHLCDLLDHCDEETRSVLVVGKHSQTLGHLSENAFVIVTAEHSFFYLRALIVRYIFEFVKGVEIGEVGVTVWLFLELVNLFALLLRLHVEEGPRCDT